MLVLPRGAEVTSMTQRAGLDEAHGRGKQSGILRPTHPRNTTGLHALQRSARNRAVTAPLSAASRPVSSIGVDMLRLQSLAGNRAAVSLLSARASELSSGLRVQRDTITPDGEAGIKVKDCKRAREAYVYIPGDGFVYKAFARIEIGEQLWAELQKAKKGGIPIPASTTYYGNLTFDNGDKPKRVFVIRSEFLSGQVFFAAKPGGAKVFSNRIKEIGDPGTLRKIKAGLLAAQELGMTDPQGFITDNDRLVFFDLHLRGTGSAVDSLLEAVDAQLALATKNLDQARDAALVNL
jgi:hypothetical protein